MTNMTIENVVAWLKENDYEFEIYKEEPFKNRCVKGSLYSHTIKKPGNVFVIPNTDRVIN